MLTNNIARDFSAGISDFSFNQVIDEQTLGDVYALRFEVYCQECELIPPEQCCDGQETDAYDRASLHFCATDLDDTVLGTVRLVQHSDLGFPLESYHPVGEDTLAGHLREATAEISRLAISKARLREALRTVRRGHRSARPNVVFGLFKLMYHESKRQGLSHWLAAMEPSLARLLERYHIPFQAIGPQIDYYGMVTPYYASVDDIERSVHARCPSFFAQFLDGLEPCYHPSWWRPQRRIA